MARWSSCNVLKVGPEGRQVWRFGARGNDFAFDEDAKVPNGQALPNRLVGKTWRTLWQKKLNIAWLPPEQVYLRVVQLPQANFDETFSMLELQLEKLSPLPVTQMVWSFHPLPQSTANQQTLIVVIVARSLVEEFLGKLEQDGFLADRLELGILDQLQQTPADRDGAWIYPGAVGGWHTALVAWWSGGVLQHLGLVNAPPGETRSEALCAQLTQMAWAGEIEGWLKEPPRLYLVAEAEAVTEWEPLLRLGLRETVEVVKPLPPVELAGATARRAAQASPKVNLLPPEVSARYQQQFVDRLWMRGLGAVLSVYVIGVLVYFAAVQVRLIFVRGVENDVARISGTYTNAMQLRARYQILKDRQDLKYAALECWKAAAASWVDGLKMQALDLREGKKLLLSGSAPSDGAQLVLDFNEKLRKVEFNSQPLFKNFTDFQSRKAPDGAIAWSFTCELNRSETP